MGSFSFSSSSRSGKTGGALENSVQRGLSMKMWRVCSADVWASNVRDMTVYGWGNRALTALVDEESLTRVISRVKGHSRGEIVVYEVGEAPPSVELDVELLEGGGLREKEHVRADT